ncbi:hypothetical protein [Burkholderia sp. PU8-34]
MKNESLPIRATSAQYGIWVAQQVDPDDPGYLTAETVEPHEQAACAGAMSMAQGFSMVVAPLAGTMLYELHPAMPFASIGVVLAVVFVASQGQAQVATRCSEPE